MTIHRAVLATNQVDNDGKRFSDEALRQMAGGLVGKLVTVDFNASIAPVGKVISAEYRDGHVSIVVDMEEPKGPFIVPSYYSTSVSFDV